MTAVYDRLAGEYYDPVLHPTCSDFRRASALLLDAFLHVVPPRPGLMLELGAGRSLLMERWRAAGLPPRTAILTDQSVAMLAYSRALDLDGAHLVVADAARLPLADRQAGFVCASLGDPFNTAATWAEVRRVLAPGGVCVFTTPAHTWTEHFRARYQNGHAHVASFLVDRRIEIEVPSYVLSEPDQAALFRGAGLEVLDIRGISRAALPNGVTSPKLVVDGFPDTGPIATGYLVGGGV